jgi:hypothetical protein
MSSVLSVVENGDAFLNWRSRLHGGGASVLFDDTVNIHNYSDEE